MTRKLNSYQLYEIDGELYSLEELREFIRISKESCKPVINNTGCDMCVECKGCEMGDA